MSKSLNKSHIEIISNNNTKFILFRNDKTLEHFKIFNYSNTLS